MKLEYNKQSVEENLIQRAVKRTIQILLDKGLIDTCPHAERVLKHFLFVMRRVPDIKEANDFVHKHKLKNNATSNMKNYQVLTSIGLYNVGI